MKKNNTGYSAMALIERVQFQFHETIFLVGFLLFALGTFNGYAQTFDFVVADFESDAIGTTYQIFGQDAQLSAKTVNVVANPNPTAGNDKSLSSGAGLGYGDMIKFEVTLPDGYTLADCQSISFDVCTSSNSTNRNLFLYIGGGVFSHNSMYSYDRGSQALSNSEWGTVSINLTGVYSNSDESLTTFNLFMGFNPNTDYYVDNVKLVINGNVVTKPVASVSLKNNTSLVVGATEQLTATVLPNDATNKSVTWNSSNPSVVTVSATGLITAVTAGNATITVTTVDGSKTAQCNVNVTQPAYVAVESVSLKSATSLVVGATEQLIATVWPENATNKSLSWNTNAPSVATVNPTTGLVTAVGIGTATITVYAESKFATCIVTVTAANIAVTGVSLNESTTSLVAGTTEQLTATVSPSNATNKNVTWNSSNPSVAIVSPTGLITAVAAGTATITVDASGKTATCIVTVTAASTVYMITATAGPNGYISPSGAVSVNSGDNQTFTFTPNSGYVIDQVLVNGTNNAGAVSAGSYTFTGVASAGQTIHVTFKSAAPSTYTITAIAGLNGSISPSGIVSVNSGGGQTFTITPNSGYRIDQVLIDGINNPTAVSSGSHTFSNVTANHTIAVSFTEEDGPIVTTFTIIATAGSGGCSPRRSCAGRRAGNGS